MWQPGRSGKASRRCSIGAAPAAPAAAATGAALPLPLPLPWHRPRCPISALWTTRQQTRCYQCGSTATPAGVRMGSRACAASSAACSTGLLCPTPCGFTSRRDLTSSACSSCDSRASRREPASHRSPLCTRASQGASPGRRALRSQGVHQGAARGCAADVSPGAARWVLVPLWACLPGPRQAVLLARPQQHCDPHSPLVPTSPRRLSLPLPRPRRLQHKWFLRPAAELKDVKAAFRFMQLLPVSASARGRRRRRRRLSFPVPAPWLAGGACPA